MPSGSRLTLEGVKSLAAQIKELAFLETPPIGTSEEIKGKADEIIREVEGLIQQVIDREARIYEWASGE